MLTRYYIRPSYKRFFEFFTAQKIWQQYTYPLTVFVHFHCFPSRRRAPFAAVLVVLFWDTHTAHEPRLTYHECLYYYLNRLVCYKIGKYKVQKLVFTDTHKHSAFYTYAMRIVYLSLHPSVLQYGTVIWDGASKNVLSPLRVQQSNIIRYYV